MARLNDWKPVGRHAAVAVQTIGRDGWQVRQMGEVEKQSMLRCRHIRRPNFAAPAHSVLAGAAIVMCLPPKSITDHHKQGVLQ
jgi:hypothetical protein